MSNHSHALRTSAAGFGTLAAGAVAFGLVIPSLATHSVLIAVAAFAVTTFVGLRLLRKRLRSTEQAATRIAKRTDSLTSELHSMQVLLHRFPECSMPTTNWSMKFCHLHALMDLLDEHRPESVVELGSGISTLLFAAWMKEAGRGYVWSVDHDERWASLTTRYLARHGLDRATVTIAPLTDRSRHRREPWYDLGVVSTPKAPIDLLVVDGPPAGLKAPESRFPALGAFFAKMSPNAVVVLDDYHRLGEKRVIEAWLSEYREFELVCSGPVGMATLVRDSTRGAIDSAINIGTESDEAVKQDRGSYSEMVR